MPIVSINRAADNIKYRRKPIIEAFAKRAVHRLLSNLKVGRLVLEEQGEVANFGQDADKATIVANISVHNTRAYRDVLLSGSIGAGESYMRGDWTSADLLKLIRLMVLNMALIERMDASQSWLRRVTAKVFHGFNLNNKAGSKRNIAAHYDLSNEFFALMLDKSMMYSAAIFERWEQPLEAAALNKLDRICQRLQLKPSDHLLEIGTGWGGMAIHAAKHYGCRVTTTTLSQQQYQHAKEWVEREGLQDRIELLLRDYRDLSGQYDKLVSIEMIEAVGHQYYGQYFTQCSRLLKQSGLMLIQAITIADQRYQAALRSVDFIQKYIFPGGCLPSTEVVARHVARDTDMQIVALEDITAHYAQTLRCWRERFWNNIERVKQLGFSTTFIRMWEFYLCYCEGGFAERVIGTAQYVMAKPAARLESGA